MSQAAESLRALPLKLVLEPGLSEAELARRYAGAVEQLYPLVDPLITSILTLHLRHATQTRGDQCDRAQRRRAARLARGCRVVRRPGGLHAARRGSPARRAGPAGGAPGNPRQRGRGAAGAAGQDDRRRGDARLGGARPLLDASLRLLDAAEAEGPDFPQLRAGASSGAALPRAGDWFGRPVNLASRITSVARPGSLLADRALHEAAEDAYRWSFAGERRLKGIKGPGGGCSGRVR